MRMPDIVVLGDVISGDAGLYATREWLYGLYTIRDQCNFVLFNFLQLVKSVLVLHKP
jgi:hypothetical protein